MIAKLDKIFENKINYFNDDKTGKNEFLNAGGTALRLDLERLMIKAKTKDRDWHYFRKLSTHKILDK